MYTIPLLQTQLGKDFFWLPKVGYVHQKKKEKNITEKKWAIKLWKGIEDLKFIIQSERADLKRLLAI